MKTLIVSAFPGCGKTYLCKHQKDMGYSVIDMDSSIFKNSLQWESTYVDCIKNKMGAYDFVLISQHDKVLLELARRNIPFVTVAPNNSERLLMRERQLIKQQWFGRFILRDNFHIVDMEAWLIKLIKNYDIWTNPKHLKQYNPLKHFALMENQYLEDIINELYLCKEDTEYKL